MSDGLPAVSDSDCRWYCPRTVSWLDIVDAVRNWTAAGGSPPWSVLIVAYVGASILAPLFPRLFDHLFETRVERIRDKRVTRESRAKSLRHYVRRIIDLGGLTDQVLMLRSDPPAGTRPRPFRDHEGIVSEAEALARDALAIDDLRLRELIQDHCSTVTEALTAVGENYNMFHVLFGKTEHDTLQKLMVQQTRETLATTTDLEKKAQLEAVVAEQDRLWQSLEAWRERVRSSREAAVDAIHDAIGRLESA